MSNTHKDITVLSAAQKRALLAELLQKKASQSRLFPLSFAQQRLWFLDQLEPNTSSYNIPTAVSLAGTLNIAALQQTLNEIVRRHEALRTSFGVVEGQPVQVIAPTLTLALPLVNLQEFSEVERDKELLRLAKEEAQQPFDLTQCPLLRATLLQLSDAEYVLLFTMHHIISDAWSITLLIQEVATLYTAFSTGKPSPLPELPIQYADFAVWQRQWLQGETLEAQLAYWQQQIGSNPPILQLPTDRPRPVIQTFRGATQSFSLPTDLTTALKALSKKAGVTLFMTLLAAFKILLHRYTSQDDILVGSPIANRNRVETESLIGCFVNTLVLRTSLEGNPSFWELLERVRECTLSAYAHQDLPFEYLVEKLQPERDLSHNPLFQVSFVLQNTPMDELQLPGLTISFLKSENQTAKFDLSLDISENQLGLAGLFEYNTDLFDATTINRMVEYFCTLLSGIVANPQQSISNLPLLSGSEQRQLLGGWNQEGRRQEVEGRGQKVEGRSAELDLCVHQLFAAQVERTPDAIAVVFENQQLTYRELNQRANQLAHHLQTLGVAPEVLVGICVERSVDLVVGILGILKAGGAYVPLDPAYPQERLAFMLSDSQVSVLLTQSKLLTALPEHSARVMCLDSDWQDASPPDPSASPANLAYVIYTSGSTGKPKGVLISHANVVRLLAATQSWFHFSEQDVWTLFHSYAFDFSVWELWGALLYGGRLVVVPYWISRSPEAFYNLLCQERVTVLNQTPSAFRQIIRTEESLGNEQNLSLRLVIFGGEALELQSLRPWFDRHGDQVPQLVNMYGITETTVHVTYRPLAIADLSSTGSAIGRPIPDLQVYVLDHYLQPVPIGVPGEMYVGGAGLARGYLNRPDLTPERFIPHPYSNKPGARLYKSGDLVRYLLNGDIEYLGRIDQQVKMRGFRIELGEIEAVLSQYPAVQASVVVLREDTEDKRLVAYTVPQPEQLLTINELRQFLKGKLPNYMMPSAFVILEALPLTPNGKIDRRALPAPETAISVAEAFVAPCTPVEEVIAGIWTQVLGLQMGTHDNFFELGGHSLLATQVISRLREAFQVELPLQCLFESPTVVGLAKRIETACRAKQGRSLPPIVPISRNRELPLSFAQQRLWFLEQLEPGAYNIPAALRLQGALNLEALTHSFNEVVKRHEALRTSFIAVDGQPMQAIAPSLTLELPLIDLTQLHPSQRQAEVQRLATEDTLQPFDLTCCPLLKVTLVRLDAAEHIVLLTMHHIISDAWSMGVLLKEVAALYAAFSNHQPSPLPKLNIQYPDFAVWQRQWLQGELLQTQINYWKQQLGSTSTRLALPTPNQRTVPTNQGASQSFALSQELTRAITQMSRQAGVTLFMTLLAAFQASLYCFTGTEEIRVGSPIANRHSVEIEGLIGFFVNTLVLRIDLSGNPSFQELLVRSRQVTLAAYAHQDLPFEKLVEELQPQRNLHNPLYQAWFVLHNAPMPSWELPGLTLTPSEINTAQTARHDLLLAVWESREVIEGTFDYKTQLLDKAAVTRLIKYFETLLHHVTNHPNMRLNELAEILSHTDKEQQLIQKREIQTSNLQKLKKIERKPIGNL